MITKGHEARARGIVDAVESLIQESIVTHPRPAQVISDQLYDELVQRIAEAINEAERRGANTGA